MRFCVGVMDAWFGERVEVEVAGPDGKPVKRAVTKKLGTPARVHMLRPSTGYTVEEWVIEQEDQVEGFRDRETGDLYVVTVFDNGVPRTTLLLKEEWEQARRLLESM